MSSPPPLGPQNPLKQAAIIIQRLEQRLAPLEQAEQDRVEPIAIVGIGCRFPGGADTPEAFWNLLDAGRDAVLPLESRWALLGAHPSGEVPRWAGLLTQAVDEFDAAFFGISPREARSLDPQHRLLLEVAWEALENAGIPPRSLDKTRTGVFIGAWSRDYAHTVSQQPPDEKDAYSTTGNMLSVAAGRLSFTLGLQGPCLTLDTACSSSLVSIHLACRSLRARESDLALAGGVNLLLSADTMEAVARTQALSPDGRCRTFDASATGFVRGEGCGLLVLKRLADAQRDGDRVWALLRGSAINQDGRSTGLTAPNVLAQEALLREALKDARVEAGSIGYVETHGTGTSLGDPIEVEALRTVVGPVRLDHKSCVLGAVKTNIGHLEAAAGVAGVVKAVLALWHERIPKNLNFRTLNAHIELGGTSLTLATEPVPWPRGERPRFAGVSSFGLSGTNAHVVLQEAPLPQLALAAPARASELMVLSASSAAALHAQAGRLGEHLQAHPELPLYDIAQSLVHTRSALEHRLVIPASGRQALQEALASAAQGKTPPGATRGTAASARGKIAFLFAGQGAQLPGMGRGLYAAWSVFREVFDRCLALFDRQLERPLRAVMWAAPGSADAALLNQTAYTQPALFTLEYALNALWNSWGVTPDYLLGHSIGELVAACVAGVFSLEDAARLCAARGRLMQALPTGGGMISIAVREAEVAEAVRSQTARVSIAAVNGPEQVVIAGEEVAVAAIAAGFAARGIHTKKLAVSHAFHSPLMEPMLEPFWRVAETVRYQRPALALVSNLSGNLLADEVCSAEYWVRHLRESVRFADGIQVIHKEGVTTFVEVGPQATLLGLLPGSLPEAELALFASLRREREEAESVLAALGGLWTNGQPIAWGGVFPAGGRRVPLPTYPWQRQRYWVEAPVHTAERLPPRQHAGEHPLLGLVMTLSTQTTTHLWETTLDLKRLPWLSDHRVQEVVVFPGAAYLEMALGAGRKLLGQEPFAVTDVRLIEALVVAMDPAVPVQLVTTQEDPGCLRFQVASAVPGASPVSYRVNVRGMLRRVGNSAVPAPLDLVAVRGRMKAAGAAAAYAALNELGLQYGAAFQGITELWQGEGEVLGRIQLPPAAGSSTAYVLHPALLDACFQVMASSLVNDGENTPWLPVEVGSLRVLQRPESELFCYVRMVPAAAAEATERRRADLWLVDGTGTAVAEIRGLLVKRLPSGRRLGVPDERFLVQEWEPVSVPAPKLSAGRWLLMGGGGGLGQALRAALEATGQVVVEVLTSPANLRAVLAKSFPGTAPTAVVHLGSLDGSHELSDSALELGMQRGCDSVLATVQALVGMGYRDVPRLWLVTRGAQALGAGEVAVMQSPLIGLGRVIAMEHGELRCGQIDLDPSAPAQEVSALVAELLADDAEQEIALRGGQRQVARLSHQRAEIGRRETIEPAHGRPFRLEQDQPGILDGLVLRATERRAPAPGEVEIAVAAAGLNFVDVMKAMGIYPGLAAGTVALGGECAGRIVAVGRDVESLRVGQEVVAATGFCFGTHVTVAAAMVVPRPANLSAAQAAALPLVFMTAWYGLAHLGRLRAGERVLIHSATGGTGLAAVQVARHLGAEVFATAGTPEKRAWLREQGIAQAMDSRALDFAAQVKTATGGQGVDVVLNSLSGEAIEASLSALAADGRFIELGKTDIYADRPLGLGHFQKSLSYSAVDLAGLAVRRPDRFAALLTEVMDLVAQGVLQALPVESVPISRAAEAFRKMAQARHLGKLVLTLEDPAAQIRIPNHAPIAIRADGSYLVTGGLGGLGLSVAGWLAAQGAGHVVLMGRSGAATPEQKAAVSALAAKGTRVTVASADVAQWAQLEPIFQAIAESATPLRGVVHAAGLLDDGMLLQQSPARLRTVLAPKAQGALHLHQLTKHLQLDFFVLYASAAGLLGAPGQGNYAAANTFLDALAHYRRAQGLPALSIEWGAYSEVGLAAAQDNRGERLIARGMRSMTPDEGLAALGQLLAANDPQVGVIPLNLRQWAGFNQEAATSARLSRLWQGQGRENGQPAGDRSLLERLAAATPAAQTALLEEVLSTQAAQVLRVPEGKLDVRAPLTSLGMDSLMGLELRNRIETTLGIKLSATFLWTYPTVSVMSRHFAEVLRADVAAAESSALEVDKSVTDDVAALATLGALTDSEKDALLAEKLALIQDLVGE